jgi:catechol 2,3-dioxygenase-like lactoylglutathione lyase family enzyme
MDLKINAFQHLGIPVTDLKKSEKFYEGLGFQNVMGSTFEMNGNKGFVVMMRSGDMIIEIYELPAAELAEIKNRKNGHIDHIAFDVDDIDVTFSLLKRHGYHIVEEAPVFLDFWDHGCRYFNMLGPDGERLEFNQILKA